MIKRKSPILLAILASAVLMTPLSAANAKTVKLTSADIISEAKPKPAVDCKGLADGARMRLGNITYQVVYTKADAKKYGKYACTSNVTDLSNIKFDSNFNEDISKWDVSNVTNMANLFKGAYFFNQDISGWDVSQVSDMSGMFNLAYDFNQDVSKWDVSSVKLMTRMFNEAYSFNQDISGWEVGGVKDFTEMFKNASDFNQDLSNWCVKGVVEEPSDFRLIENPISLTWEKSQPVWGACPTEKKKRWWSTSN